MSIISKLAVWLSSGPANAGKVATADATGVVWTTPGGAGGPPSGSAGGDLAGSYPNPTLAAAATASFVLTTDPRLSDAREPTAHASDHELAGSDRLRGDRIYFPQESARASRRPLSSGRHALKARR